MRVMRLAKRVHSDLTSGGAVLTGGRWNSKGKHVVYTSSCGALAVVEYLAHVKTTLPKGLMLMTIEIPDTLAIERVKAIPADPMAFVHVGDDWLDSTSTPVLEVPSVLVPRQLNYLINPQHPLAGAIRLVESNPFAFDSRLLSAPPTP
jgi:RES domain-containing protein